MRTFIAGKATIEDRSSELGMTLIEIMVGMAVVAVILSVVIGGIGNFLDSDMKEESNKLASTIRYLYNKSATERLYLRIAYDMDEDSYRVESSTEPFLVRPINAEQVAELEKVAEGDGEEASAAKAALSQIRGNFSDTESYLLKGVRLVDGIGFKDIQTSYQKEKIAAGMAYTYFFPNGFATPTVINLQDDDDEINYSLEILPLSGRVRIESQYKELARVAE